MSFSSEWLSLREPVDLAARDRGLLTQAAAVAGRNVVALDLGSGTGSTARAFAGLTGHAWTWRFVDGDARLLDIARHQHPGSDCIVMNLRDIDDLPLDGASLVTASALLDLMPVDWMTRLAARLRDVQIPFYAALNYDGLMSWTPPLDGDHDITRAFNIHQQTDKGIGAAMGPNSGELAAEILSDHGFDVTLRASPWVLGPEHADLHRQLIAGIGDAAAEVGDGHAVDWVMKRQAAISDAVGTIGHTDLLAIPRMPQ